MFYANDTTAFGVKAVATAGIAGFGLFTTSMLHWVSSPYIHKLYELPRRESGAGVEFEAETRTLFGRKRLTTISRANIVHGVATMRPWASFVVDKRIFYWHVDDLPADVANELGVKRSTDANADANDDAVVETKD